MILASIMGHAEVVTVLCDKGANMDMDVRDNVCSSSCTL